MTVNRYTDTNVNLHRARADGTFDLDYDDGEMEVKVAEDMIRIKEGVPKSGRSSPPLEAGDKVEANYKGRGKWFPGKIKRVRLDGSYDVDYNDGESETAMSADMVRSLDSSGRLSSSQSPNRKPRIEEGSKVEANYKGKGKFYPGRVKRDRGDGTFDIDYNDGEQEIRVPEEMIRLTDMGSMSLKSKTALEEGTKVEGNYKGKGRWYPAVIKR